MSFRTAIKTPPTWSARTYVYVHAGVRACVRVFVRVRKLARLLVLLRY